MCEALFADMWVRSQSLTALLGSLPFVRLEQTAEADRARLALIVKALGGGYEVAADVAMGEPAGKCKPPPPPPSPTKKDKPEKLEWYGFIRLVVFAKPTSPLGAKLFPASEDAVAAGSGGTRGSGGGGSGGGSVVTAVIPCGAKKCGNPTSDWCEVPKAGDPPLLPPYAAGRSPDKGAGK